MKEYFAEVTHLKQFHYDPLYITQLNIVAKDTDKTVVQAIPAYDFSDPMNKLWFGVDQTI